jgi:hypothetical protein
VTQSYFNDKDAPTGKKIYAITELHELSLVDVFPEVLSNLVISSMCVNNADFTLW